MLFQLAVELDVENRLFWLNLLGFFFLLGNHLIRKKSTFCFYASLTVSSACSLSGKKHCLKHQIPFGRLALKIHCVLSFTEDAGRCLDPSHEIAGGERQDKPGVCCGLLLEVEMGAGKMGSGGCFSPLYGAESSSRGCFKPVFR